MSGQTDHDRARIIEAHEDMLLCWGLTRAIEEGRPMNCSGCEINTMEDAS